MNRRQKVALRRMRRPPTKRDPEKIKGEQLKAIRGLFFLWLMHAITGGGR